MIEDRQDLPSPRPSQPDSATRGRSTPTDPFEPVVVAVAGGHLVRSQDVVAGGLLQAVDVCRPDGSVWRAYQRHVALPTHGANISRVIRDATEILALVAGAVAATETARVARSAAMGGDRPAWRCTYGSPWR